MDSSSLLGRSTGVAGMGVVKSNCSIEICFHNAIEYSTGRKTGVCGTTTRLPVSSISSHAIVPASDVGVCEAECEGLILRVGVGVGEGLRELVDAPERFDTEMVALLEVDVGEGALEG
jgi:hypothetical protein